MRSFCQQYYRLAGALALTALLSTGQALASGPVGEHVNHLQDNLDHYAKEVTWLIVRVDGIVDTYEREGREAAKSDALVDIWEEVDFHAAVETNYVPIYANIWQGLYGVKQAIDGEAPVADVRGQQAALEQSLWQALGAVKLAAQYQQRGLLERVKTTETDPSTPAETLDTIKQRLDRVVAKYAEQVYDEATDIVHQTYLNLFEGLEGALIEQDAALVEDLEKDFNVTLPLAIENRDGTDRVREIVAAMHGKLERAKSLLVEAEENRKDVF